MKEQFRHKSFRDGIKIKVDSSAELSKHVRIIDGTKYWIGSAMEVFSACEKGIQYYMKMGIKLTVRQLYYHLVGQDIIPNVVEVYTKFSNMVADGRYVGLFDWAAMEDRNRVPKRPAEWTGVSDIMDSVIYSYRLPRWDDQEYYIEIFSEKDALTSVLEPIASKWHVHYCINRGYSSASAMYDLSKRIKRKIKEGKKVVLLYLGDHDPSGLDMLRDMNDRIQEFLTQGDTYTEPDFKVVPVTLTMEQIKLYDCPPNPAKLTDPRAKWYIEEYGEESWEVDALKPTIIQELVEDKLLEYLDMDKYNAWKELEDKHKEQLKDAARHIDSGEDNE